MTHTSPTDGFQSVVEALEALPDAVLIADSRHRVRFINERATSVLGYDPAELLDASVHRILPKSARGNIQQAIQQAQEADERSSIWPHFAVGLRHRTGVEIPSEITVTTFQSNGEQFLLFTCRERRQGNGEAGGQQAFPLSLDHAQGFARVGSWQWDIETDAVSWSNELCRIFGISPEDPPFSYNQYLLFIHPDDREYVRETIQEAFATRSSFDMEHRIIRSDGAVRMIYGQGAASVDENGVLRAMIGTAQDITERKAQEEQQFQLALEQTARQEAERTKERFQFLAEVSEVLGASLEYEVTLDQLVQLLIPRLADWCSVNTFERTGTINRLALGHRNPEKQRILETVRARGFLPHGDETHPLTRALRYGQPELITDVTDEMLQRMARNAEHLSMMRQLDPTSFMMVPLIARGRAFGVVTFGMDDSGRHYSGEDLQLAIEVTHRAAVSIDNAKLFREAREAARLREEFVSLVSHELKTPLTVIKGYMQVLERHLDQPEWEAKRILTTRERLSTQIERLELLVADILDVSRIQRGRLDLNFEPDTDVVELAHQVVDRFDDAVERLPGHTIRVRADGPVRGRWDAIRLDQVFSNLLSNALKYSPDGGTIEIQINRERDAAVIEVWDEGIGIGHQEQEHLFQPFQRAGATSRGISGTGLGLYITRQIVEEHGGRVAVQSEPGSYTVFRVWLPYDPEAGVEPDTGLPPEGRATGHVQSEQPSSERTESDDGPDA